MPNISLPTGKTIYISDYEYYFQLQDEDVDNFFQSCIADDLGRFIDDPFSNSCYRGKLQIEEFPDIDEIPTDEDFE